MSDEKNQVHLTDGQARLLIAAERAVAQARSAYAARLQDRDELLALIAARYGVATPVEVVRDGDGLVIQTMEDERHKEKSPAE